MFGSNERSGQPLASREQTIVGVWVDLAQVFGRGDGACEGIDTSQPAAGGLFEWLRTADGVWLGRVTYMAMMHDGSTLKAADQLVPATALRKR